MCTTIQVQNDTARRELTLPVKLKTIPCMTLFTNNLLAKFPSELPEIIESIKVFEDFGGDDVLDEDGVSEADPHREHDFGVIVHNSEKIFWKFDYYDNQIEYGSENPADIKATTRVLTIMMASDY